MKTRREYKLNGKFCRAHVWWFDTGAVITGRLAGELVAKVFDESDSDEHVYEWACSLAYDGRWPRETNPQTGTTLLDLHPVVVERRAS